MYVVIMMILSFNNFVLLLCLEKEKSLNSPNQLFKKINALI